MGGSRSLAPAALPSVSYEGLVGVLRVIRNKNTNDVIVGKLVL